MPHTKRTPETGNSDAFALAREISPRRKSTEAHDIPGLVREQLLHFGIEPASPYGQRLGALAESLYRGHADLKQLWALGVAELKDLGRKERIERFAAQKFLCFQLAKMLDTLQYPFRRTYQSLVTSESARLAKGAYPIFDNVTAIFASRPVIARTATYIYACAEWVDDAFQGKELLHEIYSRLLNPTSVTLASQIVDVEAGPLAHEYFAWNFNSGMAAVDGVLSHLVGYRDIVLASRNVYGGVYQLLHDWYGKKANLDVAVVWFDGYTEDAFLAALGAVEKEHADRLADGRRVYVYLESPCNPHGYVLDVPAITRAAHARGLEVICDSTVGTPFLHRPLQRADPAERPDFIIHSYTKDLSGHGSTTAGVAIARNERMFIPKGDTVIANGPDGTPRAYAWDDTLFWNVYYVKGAFLDADKAFEVLTGMHTLEARMLQKAINTLTLADFLGGHPQINVHCNAVPGHENAGVREKCLYLGLPAPLFTIDFEGRAGASAGGPTPARISRTTFKRFFDCLEPTFGHQVSLGQPNTVVLCPAITSHSEMSEDALRKAGIAPTTVRIAVGLEDPRTLAAHLVKAAESTLDRDLPGFSSRFPAPESMDAAYRRHSLDVHRRHLEALPGMREMMK
jgi:cystathionine beta-lyase/cystathionine gamma-synthase